MATPYQKKEYTQSDAVTQAQQALQSQQANKPGQYQSQFQGGMNDLMGQIQGRDKFQYDVNADALYQQAAQRYIQQGQQGMMDTMGQAVALTGGYGNSYAQTAGQQTYQNYLQGLTDLIPQYQQMAMQQYQMEGDDLLNRYNLLAQQEESAYNRYQDSLSRYYADLDRMQSAYDNERSFDYGKWSDQQDFDYGMYRDSVGDEQWQNAFDYQKEQDQLAYDQWLQEFEHQKQQDELAYQQWLQEFEYQKMRDAASGSGSSGGRSGGSGSSGSGKSGVSSSAVGALKDALNKASGGENITFKDVGTAASYVAASGGDAGAFITAARQDGYLTNDQYKSLKYTFGY